MAKRIETKTISIGDKIYPKILKEIKGAPSAILVKGATESINAKGVAIVGTRRATRAGLKTAEEIAYTLGKSGFAIISGLAMGIDTAAHIGALRANARTIAVLGNGIDKIYPTQNENLADRILENGGAIISEYEPGVPSYKTNFLQRNRITSGLAVAVVIVEAPLKSGAINTATWAADQGKPVFVIPGPINHENYRGSHKLIRDGATLASGAEDILEDLGISIEINGQAQEKARTFKNESEKKIFEAIKNAGGAISIDEIIESTELDIETVNINLGILVIERAVLETPNGYTI